MDITQISVSQIVPNAANRAIGGLNEDGIKELAESIKTHGVLQAITVRPKDDKFEIIAGERRWRASQIAGLTEIPAIVKNVGEREAVTIRTVENLQREDISPMDEAENLAILSREGLSNKEIAAAVCKPESYISRMITITNLIPDFKSLVVSGFITKSVAVMIARYPKELQAEILGDIDTNEPAPSVHEIKYLVAHRLKQLSGVPWSMSDTKLCGGACKACAKRTGANLDLFGDYEKKDDRCLDAECFDKKLAEYIEREYQKLKKKGKAFKLTCSQEKADEETLTYSQYEYADSDDIEAQGIFIDGYNAGKVMPIKRKVKKSSTQGELVADQKSIKKQENLIKKARNEMLKGMASDILDAAHEAFDYVDESLALLAIFAGVARKLWYTIGHDGRVAIAKLEGWEFGDQNPFDFGLERIGKADLYEVLDLVALFTFGPAARVMNYATFAIPSEFTDVATALNVDLERRIAEASGKYNLTMAALREDAKPNYANREPENEPDELEPGADGEVTESDEEDDEK